MTPKEFEQDLHDLETRLDRLKALYEQWFQGIERLEPSVPRKEVDRKVYLLRRALPRNTALRFRFHQTVQRYTSYSVYWKRVARQIEEGTYRRDVLKARQQREEMRKGRAIHGTLDPRDLEPIDDFDATENSLSDHPTDPAPKAKTPNTAGTVYDQKPPPPPKVPAPRLTPTPPPTPLPITAVAKPPPPPPPPVPTAARNLPPPPPPPFKHKP